VVGTLAPVIRVAEIWRYPVKSMAGEQVESCEVDETGLLGDRRWALIDGTPERAGKALTIRQHPELLRHRARLVGDAVQVDTPDDGVQPLGAALVARLSAAAARALELREQAGANFDESPVLVLNLASVRAFEIEAGVPLDHRRFRANLYLEGMAPDEELGWLGHRLRVGGAELEAVSRCVRCVVITHDPDTTATTPYILETLAQRHDTCMGVYCAVTGPGVVATGDPVALQDTL
jgi:uncharacterized protein